MPFQDVAMIITEDAHYLWDNRPEMEEYKEKHRAEGGFIVKKDPTGGMSKIYRYGGISDPDDWALPTEGSRFIYNDLFWTGCISGNPYLPSKDVVEVKKLQGDERNEAIEFLGGLYKYLFKGYKANEAPKLQFPPIPLCPGFCGGPE